MKGWWPIASHRTWSSRTKPFRPPIMQGGWKFGCATTNFQAAPSAGFFMRVSNTLLLQWENRAPVYASTTIAIKYYHAQDEQSKPFGKIIEAWSCICSCYFSPREQAAGKQKDVEEWKPPTSFPGVPQFIGRWESFNMNIQNKFSEVYCGTDIFQGEFAAVFIYLDLRMRSILLLIEALIISFWPINHVGGTQWLSDPPNCQLFVTLFFSSHR